MFRSPLGSATAEDSFMMIINSYPAHSYRWDSPNITGCEVLRVVRSEKDQLHMFSLSDSQMMSMTPVKPEGNRKSSTD